MLPLVPRLWPNSTIVCLGGGPSLTPEDVTACRGQRVIAVNDAYRLAPWADVFYAADQKWWAYHETSVPHTGLRYSIDPAVARRWPSVTVLQVDGFDGLSSFAGALRTGGNGGHQAINLAAHLGANLIVLLGYDMQPTGGQHHWHPDHPEQRPSQYETWRTAAVTLIGPLQTLGIAIINASRETALTCFPRKSLAEALAVQVPS